PLHDVDERPALGARQRPALDHPHDVALVGVVVLVVRVHRARAADDLLVAAVAPRDVDPHRDRLLGLVGDDDALADAARTFDRRVHGRQRLTRGLGRAAGRRFLLFRSAARAALDGLLAARLEPFGVAILGRALRARLAAVGRAGAAATLLRGELLGRLLRDGRGRIRSLGL